MSLKKLLRFRHTLAFRLTLLYSLSVIVLTGAFLGYRLYRDSGHFEGVDKGLLADARALSLFLDSMKGLSPGDMTTLLEHETKAPGNCSSVFWAQTARFSPPRTHLPWT